MNYFKDIDIFSPISETDQENLSDFCQIQVLQAWDILFREGDEPNALYIILSWKLSIKKDKNGQRVEIAELDAGKLVGEMAFFGEPPHRSATVIAKEISSLIVILHFSLQQMLAKYPKLYDDVKMIIEQRTYENASL